MTILVILALLAVWIIFGYNQLVRLSAHATEAFADIDVQLKRRYDLIPNLVETVKGYATHEKSAFEQVTKARAEAMSARGLADRGVKESALGGAIGNIMAVAEAYPELKANQNFLELQRELSDTENKIQAARRFYNTNVRELGVKIQSFPSNIIASMFGFVAKEYFDLGDKPEQREAVKVSF